MAKLTRKEFAALCHTNAQVINTNVGRNNLVVEFRKINTENAQNKAFFDRYQKKFDDKNRSINEVHTEVVEVVKKKQPKNKSENKSKETATAKESKKPIAKTNIGLTDSRSKNKEDNDPPSAADLNSQLIVDWNTRKKKADAELVEYRAEHERLKIEKMAGKLIPVDLVFQILNIHNKSIFSTFQSDAENLASVYCEILAEGDRNKLAEITGKLSTIINLNVEKSKDLSQQELDNAIDEYSETLNRGQRK
jgi:hypothetical protein